jgi:hypothetical protein
MAYWTVIGEAIEDDLQGKAFGLTLNADSETCIAEGSSADKFFVSERKYGVVGIKENGSQIVNSSGVEAAIFKALIGTTAVGKTASVEHQRMEQTSLGGLIPCDASALTVMFSIMKWRRLNGTSTNERRRNVA